jgi:predicted AlkP superfamily pyrophosphatase or phosphodiesterase
MMRKRVIYILLDGLAADYFDCYRGRLVTLDELARTSFLVERVRPAVPGTSRPGRATILTGASTSVHGVYGNSILDGASFRPARATDIRCETIAAAAKRAGHRVVSIGFGMVSPDDTTAHVDPWWEHIATRGLTNIKTPAHGTVGISPTAHDPEGVLAPFLRSGSLTASPDLSLDGTLHPHMIGLMCDQLMLELVADVSCADNPPELILTEFATTDLLQHYHGYDSGAALWAYTVADMCIRRLLARLEAAGRLSGTTVIVCGDHGHAPIAHAIYPEGILQGETWTTEGASLHVSVRDAPHMRRVTEQLEAHGVRKLNRDHLPPDIHGRVETFVAPAGRGFERRPTHADASADGGSPIIVSTHGLSPDDPADHTMLLAASSQRTGSRSQGALTDVAVLISEVLRVPMATTRADT